MTAKYRYRGGYSVTFPLSVPGKYDVFLKQVVIHQKIRQHDTAIIRAVTKRMDWFNTLGTGTPVRIVYWGNDKVSHTFVGYVTNIRPTMETGKGTYEREIVCVAASREFRRTDRFTYRNRTAPEIATKIGSDLGFKVVTKQHQLRRPTVVQSGETYWEFLTKLAKRTGYVLHADQTTLYFLPLPDMVQAFRSRAPYLTDFGNLSNLGYDSPNVQSIDAWAGDTAEDADSLSDAAVYTSVDPMTGTTHSVRSIPGSAISKSRPARVQYTKYNSDVVAHSRAEASLLSRGAADNGMLAFEARLTVAGDSGLRPYRPVILDVRDSPLNGYWVVKEVTHTLKQGLYNADLVVGTDSIGGSTVPTGARGMRKYRDLGTELSLGFSPDSGSRPRLHSSPRGFLLGKASGGNIDARWVAS